MDFNPKAGTDNTFGMTVEEGATLTVDLQWAEPWYGVKADLDVFLLNSAGKPILVKGNPVGSTANNVGETEEPFEFFQWENDTGSAQEVQLAINRCSSTCNPEASSTATPRLKFALMENGEEAVAETEYPTSAGGDTVGPTIFGHSGAEGAISVGAVPFFDSTSPEEYSSRGPVSHYFGPVVSLTPAAELPLPQTVSKPDVVATDCGLTTFFAFKDKKGNWRFCGTSAAAPHAAAVAALMLQRDPFASPQRIREGLTNTATAVGGFPADAVGAGLIDALGAVESVPLLKVGEGEVTTAPFQESPPDVSAANPASTPTRRAVAPNTFFVRTPPKVVSTMGDSVRLALRFGASESGAAFRCKIDRGLFRRCGSRLVRRFAIGRHAVRGVARDGAGNADPTPAVYRFRVKRVG